MKTIVKYCNMCGCTQIGGSCPDCFEPRSVVYNAPVQNNINNILVDSLEIPNQTKALPVYIQPQCSILRGIGIFVVSTIMGFVVITLFIGVLGLIVSRV